MKRFNNVFDTWLFIFSFLPVVQYLGYYCSRFMFVTLRQKERTISFSIYVPKTKWQFQALQILFVWLMLSVFNKSKVTTVKL